MTFDSLASGLAVVLTYYAVGLDRLGGRSASRQHPGSHAQARTHPTYNRILTRQIA